MDSAARIGFRFFRVVVVLALAAGLAYLLFSGRSEPGKIEKEKPVPRVTVMAVHPEPETMTVDVFGTVKPRRSIRIAAEVPGRIDWAHPSFIAGGFVQKDDLLVRIDQESYLLEKQRSDVRISQADIDIRSLKQDIHNLNQDKALVLASLELSSRELDRVNALNQQQFASSISLEKVKQQHLQVQSQLQAVENRLAMTGILMDQKTAARTMAVIDGQRADLALRKTSIHAPFDGYVLEKYSEEDEYVHTGQLLGTIYQKDALDVDVQIPPEKMKWIAHSFRNQAMPEARVRLTGADGSGGGTWKARVARVMASVDATTRTIPMTIEIISASADAPGFDLKPGTFVECTIIGETHDHLFILPRHVIRTDDTLFAVRNGRLKILPVQVFRKVDETVYISSGLDPGEMIITSPLPNAIDGMALAIHDGEDR